MSVGRVLASDLDEFIEESDRRGGVGSADFAEWSADFEVELSTPVDETSDPFSDEYTDSQIAVYQELSGRGIDQDANELHPIDVDALVSEANPYGSEDVDFIARHSRTILTSVLLSDLPNAATVLDMGAGWGLSTEMFAFTGCTVDAVDINAQFSELVQRRADARGYAVTTRNSSFDTFETDATYDLAFFYESLHHAIRPWEVIARVAPHVKPGGKFTIAGEPIQDIWWTHWGLRLDPVSVYCIRKFGWFESGWSEAFLTECFQRAGFDLQLFPGLGIDHTPVGVAVRPTDEVEPATDSAVVAPNLEKAQLRAELAAVQAAHAASVAAHAQLSEEHEALLGSPALRALRRIRQLRR